MLITEMNFRSEVVAGLRCVVYMLAVMTDLQLLRSGMAPKFEKTIRSARDLTSIDLKRT
jgi:hypothetical protein